MKKHNTGESTVFEYTSEDIRQGRVKVETPEREKKGIGAGLYFLLVLLAAISLSVWFIFSAIDRVNEGLIMEVQVGELTPYYLEDGSYPGKYASNDFAAAVTVTVQNRYITNITLDSFKGIDTARAQLVFDAVVRAQSFDFADGSDAGTQPTDRVLMLAIENAIDTALGEGEPVEISEVVYDA